MSIIEQIKAEIDKRYTEYSKKMKTNDFTYYEGMADALDLFEQFIDTLESEKPIPKDLEEAAEHYASVTDPEAHGIDFIREVFIAGAEWDREQMMKEAVEGKIHPDDYEIWVNLVGYGYKFNDGEKVRVIVLPKENSYE